MSRATQSDGYVAKSRQVLGQARDELSRGDAVQASEKLWGAAAQMVKAIAQKRGWPHRTHGDLFSAVSCLVKETGDDDLSALFHTASGLHTNFYENWDPPELVASSVPAIEKLVAKLGQLSEA